MNDYLSKADDAPEPEKPDLSAAIQASIGIEGVAVEKDALFQEIFAESEVVKGLLIDVEPSSNQIEGLKLIIRRSLDNLSALHQRNLEEYQVRSGGDEKNRIKPAEYYTFLMRADKLYFTLSRLRILNIYSHDKELERLIAAKTEEVGELQAIIFKDCENF
jgi:hypothetical protein